MTDNIAGLKIHGSADMPTDHGKWLIHGPQGSGKTTLAATVAELGKTLFVDMPSEQGTQSFQAAPHASNIDIVRPNSVTQLDDLYWHLAKGGHGYRAVVIDSLTSIQKQAMRFLMGVSETAVREIRQGTAPADIRTWGQALDIMQDQATSWFGLADATRSEPMHVVMTAQTKITESEDTGSVTRVPDVQRGALSIVLSTPSHVLYTDVEDDFDNTDDDGNPRRRHILRFGNSVEYRTKARVPYDLHGKIPPILGRGKNSPNLATLSRLLRIGGTAKTSA